MWIVLSLCAAYFAYCVGTNPAGPFTTPDSLHYLNVSPMYPLGYPCSEAHRRDGGLKLKHLTRFERR